MVQHVHYCSGMYCLYAGCIQTVLCPWSDTRRGWREGWAASDKAQVSPGISPSPQTPSQQHLQIDGGYVSYNGPKLGTRSLQVLHNQYKHPLCHGLVDGLCSAKPALLSHQGVLLQHWPPSPPSVPPSTSCAIDHLIAVADFTGQTA